MGAWGVGLFSDDLALDVRGVYREHLERGASDAEAKAATLRKFEAALADKDDGPVVWLALAATQSTLGRLDDATKAAALRVLDEDQGLDRWREDAAQLRKRIAVLRRLRATLDGDQPPRRIVTAAKQRRTPLSPGDVLSYRTRNGIVFLVRVVELCEVDIEVAPRLHVLDYEGHDVPPAEVIARLPDRQREPRVPGEPSPRWWTVDQIALGVRGHKRAGFEVVCRIPERQPASPMKRAFSSWKFVAQVLERAATL